MAVHLPAHGLDLAGGGAGCLAGQALGFVGEDGQGRLDGVREVGGLAPRALQRTGVARQQAIDLGDQRHHLGRPRAAQAALAACLQGSQSLAQPRQRREPNFTWAATASSRPAPSAVSDQPSSRLKAWRAARSSVRSRATDSVTGVSADASTMGRDTTSSDCPLGPGRISAWLPATLLPTVAGISASQSERERSVAPGACACQ